MSSNFETTVQPATSAAAPRKSSSLPVFSTILKILFAVLLIAWMIRSNRLNPRNLSSALQHWNLLLWAAATIYGQIFITGVRWHMLLRTQSIGLPLRHSLALNIIGTLFNTVIPGSVGGDVIKGYYVSRRTPSRRALALTTLLVDRVLGLLGLLLLPLIAVLWNREIAASEATRVLLWMACLAAAAAIAGFSAAMLLGKRLNHRIAPLAARFRAVAVASKVLDALSKYEHHKLVILVSLLISVFNHMLSTMAFYACARAISDRPFDIHQFLFLVPLGLLTTAIPISPAGVGVGQAAFFTLFGLVPGLTGQVGSEACTVFQGVMLAVYLTGLIVYVFYRHEAQGAATE